MYDFSDLFLSHSDICLAMSVPGIETIVQESSNSCPEMEYTSGTESFQGYFDNSLGTVDLTGAPQIVMPFCNATATINGHTYQTPAAGWMLALSINNFNLPTLQLADAPAYIQNSAAAQMVEDQNAQADVPTFGFGFGNLSVVAGQPAPDGWAATDWTAFLTLMDAYLGSGNPPFWQVTLMNCLVVPSGNVELVPSDCSALVTPNGQALIIAMCLSGTLNPDFAEDFADFSFANPPDPIAQTFLVLSAPTLAGLINAQFNYDLTSLTDTVGRAPIWNEQYPFTDTQKWLLASGQPLVISTWAWDVPNSLFNAAGTNINSGIGYDGTWQATNNYSVSLKLGTLYSFYAQALVFSATQIVNLEIEDQSQYSGTSNWSTNFLLECSGESGFVQLVMQPSATCVPLPPFNNFFELNLDPIQNGICGYVEDMLQENPGITMPQFAFPGGTSFSFESAYLNSVTSLVAALVPTTPGP